MFDAAEISQVSALLDELRAKAYAAMSRSPPIKVDNLNDDVYKYVHRLFFTTDLYVLIE